MKYKEILPKRFHEVSYEKDVPNEIKELVIKQIQKSEGIYLWGNTGTGKTHIACAIGKFLLKDGFNVIFYSSGKLLEKIREDYNVNDNNVEGIFATLMDFKGILILDDIGAEKTTDWVVERLYIILNERYEQMLPTIFTSNCDLQTLCDQIGDRIVSRIAGMTTCVEVEGDDKRIK